MVKVISFSPLSPPFFFFFLSMVSDRTLIFLAIFTTAISLFTIALTANTPYKGGDFQVKSLSDLRIYVSVNFAHFWVDSVNFASRIICDLWKQITNKEQQQPVDEGRLSISVIIVGDPASVPTLFHTLDSYTKHGLFDIVGETLIYLQDLSKYDETFLPRLTEYPIHLVLGSLKNTYVHGALIELVHHAKFDSVLFLEKDFELVEVREVTQIVLSQSIKLLERVQVVRLKSRDKPGVPEFARLALGPGNDHHVFDPQFNQKNRQQDLACQLLYWKTDAEMQALIEQYNVTSITRDKYQTWVFPSNLCHWTNQAVFFRRAWFNSHMMDPLRALVPRNDSTYQRHNALEIAARYSHGLFRWVESRWKVAVGKGLFRHHDILKYPYNTSVEGEEFMEKAVRDASPSVPLPSPKEEKDHFESAIAI